jgi:ketosteroid isomerase-like protein
MGSNDVDLVQSAYAAIGRGDVASFFATMSDDVDWFETEGLPFGGHYRGPAQVGESVFGPLFADFPDFTVTPQEFIGQGPTVAVVVHYQGTASQTQAQLDAAAVHVWDVEDGKIVRFRQFFDSVKYREAVGAPS